MSLDDFKGEAWLVRKWMREAEQDIKDGTLKPARILCKGPDLRKTFVGWMKRRILRGEFRKRA